MVVRNGCKMVKCSKECFTTAVQKTSPKARILLYNFYWRLGSIKTVDLVLK